MRLFLTLFIACLTLTFWQSCKQEEICLIPQNLSSRFGFYVKDTANTFKDSVLTNAGIIFLADSLYRIVVNKSSKFAMNLSTVSDSTRFIFQSDTSTTNPSTLDTLVLHYNRQLKFISTACGFQYEFNLQKINYTKQLIDSVFILTNLVSNDLNQEHIKIVLKP